MIGEQGDWRMIERRRTRRQQNYGKVGNWETSVNKGVWICEVKDSEKDREEAGICSHARGRLAGGHDTGK